MEHMVYGLANLAGCAVPDSEDSAGPKFLRSVADATEELIGTYREERTPEDRYDYSGEMHEIADNAPDVYTYTRWQEFVDLGAWQEDPTELGYDGSDMEQAAGICLYMIAERLVRALVEEAGPFDTDDDDEDTTDEEAR